ncbi:MAG: hypothetical protein EA399_15600 [Desulfovibrionales bacterium]|nr:MAG: hypothetical protein EA399_15600 [Desulfovibrionales bacterium]
MDDSWFSQTGETGRSVPKKASQPQKFHIVTSKQKCPGQSPRGEKTVSIGVALDVLLQGAGRALFSVEVGYWVCRDFASWQADDVQEGDWGRLVEQVEGDGGVP